MFNTPPHTHTPPFRWIGHRKGRKLIRVTTMALGPCWDSPLAVNCYCNLSMTLQFLHPLQPLSSPLPARGWGTTHQTFRGGMCTAQDQDSPHSGFRSSGVFAVLLHACCGLNQNYSPSSHLCCPIAPPFWELLPINTPKEDNPTTLNSYVSTLKASFPVWEVQGRDSVFRVEPMGSHFCATYALFSRGKSRQIPLGQVLTSCSQRGKPGLLGFFLGLLAKNCFWQFLRLDRNPAKQKTTTKNICWHLTILWNSHFSAHTQGISRGQTITSSLAYC